MVFRISEITPLQGTQQGPTANKNAKLVCQAQPNFSRAHPANITTHRKEDVPTQSCKEARVKLTRAHPPPSPPRHEVAVEPAALGRSSSPPPAPRAILRHEHRAAKTKVQPDKRKHPPQGHDGTSANLTALQNYAPKEVRKDEKEAVRPMPGCECRRLAH